MKTVFCKRFCLLILPLLLAGCFDIFTPPAHDGAAEAPVDGITVILSIDGAGSQRTLMPNAVIEKYELEFKKGSDTKTATISAGGSSVTVGLDAGVWDITALGYVAGITDAVSKGTATINVIFGINQTIYIAMHPNDGAVGTLQYNVTFPSGKTDITEAKLRITSFDASSFDEDVPLTPSFSSQYSLAPGYYTVTASLKDGYQTAYRTEIVHIYPELITLAEFAFTTADFVDYFRISGFLNRTITGTAGDVPAKLYVYNNGEFEPNIADPASIEYTYWNWSWTLANFDTDTDLYFRTEIRLDGTPFYRVPSPPSITVRDQDRAGINLNVHYDIISIGGSANVRFNNAPANYRVSFSEDGKYFDIRNNGHDEEWQLQYLGPETSTAIDFQLYYYNPYTGWVDEPYSTITRQVHNQNVSDIDFGDIIITWPQATVRPLNLNQWHDGDFTNGQTEHWYSFDVYDENTIYWVRLNDSVYGDGSKTANVQAYIYRGYTFYNDGPFYDTYDRGVDIRWDDNNNGTVYIQVFREDSSGTGTYGIAVMEN